MELFIKTFIEIIVRLPSILVLRISRALVELYVEPYIELYAGVYTGNKLQRRL
jgi:hypothetical protein